MTLKTRRILFYALTVIFIIFGTVVVFYSNGWRLDLETLTIDKLGGLFFEITPRDATITIDKNQFEFKSGFLRSGTLIANLFPKNYTVKVTKSGYQSWIKELEVKPSLVTEVPPVILLPDKQDLGEVLTDNINNFWIGPKHYIAGKENRLEFKLQKLLGNNVVNWSESGDSVITKNNSSFFLTNLGNQGSALNLSLSFGNLWQQKFPDQKLEMIKTVLFYPAAENKFIVPTGNGLYLLDTEKFSLSRLHKGPIGAFKVKNNEIFFYAEGKVSIYNLSLDTEGLLINQEFKPAKDIQVSLSGYQVSILGEDGKLYIFDRKSLTGNLIAENIASMLFSPDGKKIAFTNNRKELTVYHLSDPSKDNKKNEEPAIFNIGSTEEISWHKNSAYLFIKYPTSLYLLEANNLPPINFQVIDLENKKFSYQPEENSIYLLKNSGLYRLSLE